MLVLGFFCKFCLDCDHNFDLKWSANGDWFAAFVEETADMDKQRNNSTLNFRLVVLSIAMKFKEVIDTN